MSRANESIRKARAAQSARDDEIRTLKATVEELNKELEEAKANAQQAAAQGAQVDPALAQELESLRSEKATLEQALIAEKASHLLASSQATEHIAELVSEIVGRSS